MLAVLTAPRRSQDEFPAPPLHLDAGSIHQTGLGRASAQS